MKKLLYILTQLNEDDADWLVTNGAQQQIPPGKVLIEEGGELNALYIVLDGRLGVSIPSQRIPETDFIEAGELLGEVSLADGRPPAATVTARSDVTVFAIPREKLLSKLARDTGFGARFYKAVATFLSDRIRAAARRTPHGDAPPTVEGDKAASTIYEGNVHLAQARADRLLNRLHETSSVLLTGSDLTIEDVVDVAKHNKQVEAVSAAMTRLSAARRVVDSYVARPDPVYGLTTGLGALKDRRISAEQNEQFQINIIKSHAAGIGPEHKREVVRAILLARINGMARGGSGVQPSVFSLLLDMLNKDVIPVVMSRGSIGMSDLAPMAHLALPLIGLGEVDYQGRRVPAAEAFALAGLTPVRLGPKDGLCLVSSNAASVGHGALVLAEAMELITSADIAAALSLEALQGNVGPLDERSHTVRPYPGQLLSAERMRNLLRGSSLYRSEPTRTIQDPLSFRCTAHVHGACHDALSFARRTMEIELNSTGDSPVVLPDTGTIVSNSNFHTAAIAMSFDMLALILAQMTSLATNRVLRLNEPTISHLPAQLMRNPGINCGFGVIQKTVTALNAETRFLASPTSLDFMAVAGSLEDHATNTSASVSKAAQIVDNIRHVLAIELLTASQGVSLRDNITLGRGTRAAYDMIRSVVPCLEEDDVMATAIRAVYHLLASGRLLAAVKQATA